LIHKLELPGEQAEVEAHMPMHWSDQALTKAIAEVENALDQLQKVKAPAKT
jgi:hypothetical protein